MLTFVKYTVSIYCSSGMDAARTSLTVQRRCFVFFQKSLAFSDICPYNISMLSWNIALPQYQPPLVNLLKIGGVDARSLVEIKRRHAQKRTSVSIFGLQVCKQTCYSVEQPPSLAVLIRRAFSAAARMPLVYIRSDVSAAAETHSQNYTRMYSFDDATTQMRRIFSKATHG